MSNTPVNTRAGRRDVLGMAYAAVFVVIGGLALYFTEGMSTLGAVFPQTIATALVIFSLAYIVQNLISPDSVNPPSGDGSWVRRGLLVVVMLGWVLSLTWIGFIAAGVLGFVGMILVGNYDGWTPRRVLVYAVVSAAIIGGFYTLFAVVLNVPLPPGRWFQGM